MSNPKFLKIFNQSTESIAYSRMNNPVSVRLSGTTLVVTDNIIISNNAKLSFTAPCDCTEVTHMSIGGISYNLVDALGNTTNDTFKGFSANSKVSVLIDTQNRRAYVMNGAYGYKAPYEFAKESGYKGTVGEFYKLLATLDVDKTYETVKLAGYTGTKEEFYKALSTVDEPKGLKPTIIVTIGDDIDVSEVTMNWTENGVEKSKTLAVQDKKAIFEVFEYKTYTVSVVINGKTESAPVTVDSVKQYRVKFPYFYANIEVSSPIGASISCQQGAEILSLTSTGKDTFIVTNPGLWSVSAEHNGKKEAKLVGISETAGLSYKVRVLCYVTYGIRIDTKNSNSLSAVSYLEGTDAYGMTKGSDDWDKMPLFEDIRPCIFKDGGVIKYLNPDDFNQDSLGNLLNISPELDGDVMIEFSKGGYIFTRSDDYLDIYVTNDPDNEGYVYHSFSHTEEGDCDHFWLGAFLGYLDSNVLRSVSNVLPSTSKTPISYSDDTGYCTITYFQWLWVQLLYLIKYGNTNSQIALGKGFVESNSEVPLNTGSTAASGMCAGSSNSISHMKLFGLEDFWGYFCSWISCIEYGTYTYNNYDGTASHGQKVITSYPGGKKFDNFINTIGPSSGGYISRVLGTNTAGFIASQFSSGSATTYFADTLNLTTASLPSSGGTCSIGGSNLEKTAAGIFHIRIGTSSYLNATRLAYCYPGK